MLREALHIKDFFFYFFVFLNNHMQIILLSGTKNVEAILTELIAL